MFVAIGDPFLCPVILLLLLLSLVLMFCMCVDQNLRKKYGHFRRTRGDGNCFYRAFGFAYMELLLQDPEELSRFLGTLVILFGCFLLFMIAKGT